MAYEISNGTMVCEQCNSEFEKISLHWSKSSDCSHSPLTSIQKETLIGLLMGDGCVGKMNSKNQRIEVRMITEEFLEWLSDEMGWLFTNVSLQATAAEVADRTRKTGFNPDAKVENHHDYYCVRSRSHPWITRNLTPWYESGEKVFPSDIDLTPTVLLMWYVGDGCYDDSVENRYVKIAAANEEKRTNEICKLFKRKKLPSPVWNKCKRKGGSIDCDFKWTVSQSKQLFDYMCKSPLFDGPPPGFQYKFPTEYGGTGKSMKDVEV